MVRVTNLEESLDFYCNKLGLELTRRSESPAGRYTLA
ncbi:MAG: VOC family protein, partial [Burkholderiales bacterium]